MFAELSICVMDDLMVVGKTSTGLVNSISAMGYKLTDKTAVLELYVNINNFKHTAIFVMELYTQSEPPSSNHVTLT